MAGTMRKPLENMRSFTERRQRLAEIIQDDVLVVSAAPEAVRNHDVDHPFRQDSNMYYLTGFEEPQSILVFRPGRTPETVMFVRPRDLNKEVWNGFRFGPELTKQNFAVDAAYPYEEFSQRIVGLLGSSANLYYRFYKNPEVDAMISKALEDHQRSQGRSGLGLMGVKDADEVVGDMRRVKQDLDILNMRRACDISSDAHIALMKYVKPGMNEREAEGFFNYQLLKNGCARPGYNAIMAGGPNACVLHYVYNDQTLRKGELMLVDAAGEYNYFTSDITRTFPVDGKFTEAQAEVYQAVLDVQKKMVEMVAPGVSMAELQEAGASLLTDAMLELGLFSGRKEDIMAANQHRKYYPHGIGHFLGMDVHDSGISKTRQGMNRPLEPGCILTIEPGIYIPLDDKDVAEKYRGIGVRIEDNILVTKDGRENLTERCPKEIKDIEDLMASK